MHTPTDFDRVLRLLPTDSDDRKIIPIYSGFFAYFHDAIAWQAKLSQIGNDKHNPGEPLHWARGKSADEADALMRHLMEVGTIDTDGIPHSVKVAWRGNALCQKDLERLFELPMSRGSR